MRRQFVNTKSEFGNITQRTIRLQINASFSYPRSCPLLPSLLMRQCSLGTVHSSDHTPWKPAGDVKMENHKTRLGSSQTQTWLWCQCDTKSSVKFCSTCTKLLALFSGLLRLLLLLLLLLFSIIHRRMQPKNKKWGRPGNKATKLLTRICAILSCSFSVNPSILEIFLIFPEPLWIDTVQVSFKDFFLQPKTTRERDIQLRWRPGFHLLGGERGKASSPTSLASKPPEEIDCIITS